MKEKINANETAVLIGCSLQTLNYWYAFKRMHPDNEYAKMLPDYTQEGARQTRYWSQDDIFKLIQFKNEIPKGRNGILADVTQKYLRKDKKTNG